MCSTALFYDPGKERCFDACKVKSKDISTKSGYKYLFDEYTA